MPHLRVRSHLGQRNVCVSLRFDPCRQHPSIPAPLMQIHADRCGSFMQRWWRLCSCTDPKTDQLGSGFITSVKANGRDHALVVERPGGPEAHGAGAIPQFTGGSGTSVSTSHTREQRCCSPSQDAAIMLVADMRLTGTYNYHYLLPLLLSV